MQTAQLFLLGLCIHLYQAVIQDLTHPYDQNSRHWPGFKDFNLTLINKGEEAFGFWVESNDVRSAEHVGTHMDAPRHFVQNGVTMDEIPVDQLIGKGVVIDITTKAKTNKDAEAMTSDILAWEENYGKIQEGDIVLIHCGWDQYYDDLVAYVGSVNTSDGWSYRHPGLHPDAATLLVQRKIAGLGIDALQPDRGLLDPNNRLPVHRILLPNNIFILENLTNLDKLPRSGATIIAAGQKIRGGSGGATRVIAVWGREDFMASHACGLAIHSKAISLIVAFLLFIN